VFVVDSKTLFEYWYDKVEFKNEDLIRSSEYVRTPVLRHECTNYDDLRKSNEVLELEGVERGLVIAVIKYQCTSRVLQRRVGKLCQQMDQINITCNALDDEIKRRSRIIQALQEIIFGKDRKIQELEQEITRLKNRLSALREISSKADTEESVAYRNLQIGLENLKQRYKEIAKKNRSLGGRVAHAERYKRERDEAIARAEQAEQQLNALMEQLNEESSL
jgi:chromosome segregation ATPase